MGFSKCPEPNYLAGPPRNLSDMKIFLATDVLQVIAVFKTASKQNTNCFGASEQTIEV